MDKSATTTDVLEIMHTCRAMRRLKPDPVPEDVLVKLVDAAIHAPSSSNAQNWRFVIVRDREQKRRVAELWRSGAAWYRDTIGAAPPRPDEDAAQRVRSQRALQYMLDHIEDVPVLVFIAIKKDEAVAKAARFAQDDHRSASPPRSGRHGPPVEGCRQRHGDRHPTRPRIPQRRISSWPRAHSASGRC